MTRKEFEARAVRREEKRLHLPPGWWGTWRDAHGPKGERVRWAGWMRWIASVRGKERAVFQSRSSAIRAVRRRTAS